MTFGEKLEQAVTKRPDSRAPARVLQRLTGVPEHPGKQLLPVNWAMHFGQAALLGVLRSVMAQAELRGPAASAKFTVVRLTNDQILGNATGVGTPPRTWPRRERVVGVLHKAVYAFTSGGPLAPVLRSVPVQWWNYPVLAATAVLAGLVLATFLRPPHGTGTDGSGAPEDHGDPSAKTAGRLGSVGGLLSLLAVGCPVCNKLVLVLLGTSGALTYWAPLQPLVAVASLVLLAEAALRRLSPADACPVPVRR